MFKDLSLCLRIYRYVCIGHMQPILFSLYCTAMCSGYGLSCLLILTIFYFYAILLLLLSSTFSLFSFSVGDEKISVNRLWKVAMDCVWSWEHMVIISFIVIHQRNSLEPNM